MKVSAITKFKQGDLWGAIKRLGWSQSRLAKEAGLSVSRVGYYINLIHKPNAETAKKIQIALANHGEYLDVLAIWPENFKGLDGSLVFEQTQEIDFQSLNFHKSDLHDTCKPSLDNARQYINEVLESLTPREQIIIEQRFGLLGQRSKTLEQVAVKCKVTRERIRQGENKALRKLRHPVRIKYLRNALDELNIEFNKYYGNPYQLPEVVL